MYVYEFICFEWIMHENVQAKKIQNIHFKTNNTVLLIN